MSDTQYTQADLADAQQTANTALQGYHRAVQAHEHALLIGADDTRISYLNGARQRHRGAVRRLVEIEVAMGERIAWA